MNVLLTYMSVYYMHTWFSQRSEEDLRFSGIGIMGCCGLPHGCWESCPLQEQMLLILGSICAALWH